MKSYKVYKFRLHPNKKEIDGRIINVTINNNR